MNVFGTVFFSKTAGRRFATSNHVAPDILPLCWCLSPHTAQHNAFPARPQEAPGKLISAIRRAHGGLKDDTSVIVLDLLAPGGAPDFPTLAGKPGGGTKSGCMCFARCAASSRFHAPKVCLVAGMRGVLLLERRSAWASIMPGSPCPSVL